MVLSLVKGSVVSTAKVDQLAGRKLLLVEIITVRDHGLERTGRHMVCVDAVGGPMLARVLGQMAYGGSVASYNTSS